jgi:hypothetical protein
LFNSGDENVKRFTAMKHFENFDVEGKRRVIKKRKHNISDPVLEEACSKNENVFTNAVASISEVITPLIQQSFVRGTNILLAAKTGIGKTFLVIWIAVEALRKNLVKGACFFSFEDKNSMQMPRFIEGLAGLNYKVVSANDWKERIGKKKKELGEKASLEAATLFFNPMVKKYLQIKEDVMKKYGIFEKNNFGLCVFLEMLQEKIDEGYDYFVLDSISSIFQSLINLPQPRLELLLDYPSERKVTFIVIHHCNDDGKTYGSDLLKRLFDVAYVLESDDPTKTPSIIRVIPDKPNRHNPDDHGFFIKRSKVSDNVAKHEIIDAESVSVSKLIKKPSIAEAVKAYCDNIESSEILFADLIAYLKENGISDNPDSVQNALRRLQKKGFVENLDGSWGIIGF